MPVIHTSDSFQSPLPQIVFELDRPDPKTLSPASSPLVQDQLVPQTGKTAPMPALGLTLDPPLAPTALTQAEMRWIEGKTATWGSSGSHMAGKMTFSDWVNGPASTALPAFNPKLLMNCSEFVFYSALKAGKIDRAWLKDWNQRRNFSEPFEKFMLPSGSQSIDYQIKDGKVLSAPGVRPAEGDVVLFDGSSHVMLATGREIHGKTEVISFSPLPLWGDGAFTMGKEGVAPERTTVEDLIQNLVDLYPDSPVDWAKIQIRFGPAPWVKRTHESE